MDEPEGDRPSAADPPEGIELTYRSDGGIELRSKHAAGRWIATDSPVEVSR